jgi:transposase
MNASDSSPDAGPLREQLAALETELARIKAENIRLRNEHEQRQAEVDRLRDEHEERQAEIARLRNEHEQRQAEVARLRDEHEERQAEVARLRNEHEERQAEIARLRNKHEQRQAEAARLKEDAQCLRSKVHELEVLKDGMEAQLQEALLELEELRRQLYGSKSDKLTPEQEAQIGELEEDLKEQARRDAPVSTDILEDEDEKPARKRNRRNPMPEHLERETVVLEPGGLDACPQCGKERVCLGEEVSEELEYVPAKVVCRRTVRPKYGCRCGCGGVMIAPLPPRLLPQSKLGTGLAVHLLLSRFDDHVAYYTLERIFRERHGVVVPRQQMVQWVEQVAFVLQPVVRRMFERMKQGGYLQVDETPVRVMDPEVKGKCARGYLWFYAVPGGDVYLDFQDTRGRSAPYAQLQGFTGTIQTDAYEVYDSLKKVIRMLKRIGCAAHSRRKFHRAVRDGDTRAIEFISLFRRLYRLEREARVMSVEARHELRRLKAAPLWESIRTKALALQPQLLPKSSLGKAVSYLLNEYEALTGYLESGRYEMDNNLVENAIRGPAVGRRRWLFIGHPDAGWRSAVIYSVITSCRRRGINPQEYLSDVLRRLPGMDITQIDEVLPENWKKPEPAQA